MDISLSTVNGFADYLGSLLNTGTVEFYTGTPPANADTAIAGNTLLVVLTLENPAFGAASNGVINLIDVTPVLASGTGVCTFARWKTSGGVVVMDTTVGTTGTDLTIADTNILAGNNVDITTFSYTQTAV